MNSRPIIIAACLLALAGCTPIVTTHGNMLSQNKLEQIKPQVSSRNDVESSWGPPTMVSPFDKNTWYYVGETDKREGVFAPEVEKRQMVKVSFDADDHVTEVALLDNKQARELDFVARKTPTAGKEFTAVQQFVGNLGKYNKGDKKPQSN